MTLEVRNLSAYYKEIQVLHEINLTLAKGEWASIIGLNGAGKSTLVHAIMGFSKLTSGDILLNGKALKAQSPATRFDQCIGCVMEGRQLFESLKVEEHLNLLPNCNPQHAYDLFPILHEKRHHYARHLSGGQQQMLAIALAVLPRPELLILDEPSLGLSPQVMESIWQCLAQIHDKGTTILLVEQNAIRALKMCQRAYVMTDGIFAFEGDPSILLKDPKLLAHYLSFEE